MPKASSCINAPFLKKECLISNLHCSALYLHFSSQSKLSDRLTGKFTQCDILSSLSNGAGNPDHGQTRGVEQKSTEKKQVKLFPQLKYYLQNVLNLFGFICSKCPIVHSKMRTKYNTIRLSLNSIEIQ